MAPIWRGKVNGNWDAMMRNRLETFRTVINEPGLSSMSWCVFLGNFAFPRPDYFDFGPPGQPSFHYRQFVDALTVGIDQYGWFDDPKYFKIGGKPVLVLFRTHQFEGDYQAAVDEIRDYWNEDVYLIGMSGRWHRFWDSLDQAAIDRIKPFDAITAWNALAGSPGSPGDLGSIAEWLTPRYASWRDNVPNLTVNGKPGVKVDFGPTITCQYDKSPTTGNNSTTRWARNIQDFRDMVTAASGALDPDGLTSAPRDSFLWLQTYDEWPEGTACAPSELTAAYPNDTPYEDYYGWDFLDVLREEFHGGARSNPRDPILVAPRDESTVSTTTPTLRWDVVAANPPVTGYEVRIRRADNLAQVLSRELGNVNSYTVPAGVLSSGVRYVWDMRTKNSHSNPWSIRSVERAFRVGSVSGPPAPTGVSAANGTSEAGVAVSWSPLAGASGYRVYRAPEGAPSQLVALPHQVTTTSFVDRTTLPGQRFLYSVSAFVSGGETVRSATDLGWRRTFSHSTSGQLPPTADAFVGQEQPNANWGTAAALRVRHFASGVARYSFLEFNVPAGTGNIRSAVLRLKSQNVALPGVSVFNVENLDWTETGITWNNWTVGSTATFLYKTWAVPANSEVLLDVTDAVASSGKVTLGLASDFDFTELDFWAREASSASNRPWLEVVYDTTGSQSAAAVPMVKVVAGGS